MCGVPAAVAGRWVLGTRRGPGEQKALPLGRSCRRNRQDLERGTFLASGERNKVEQINTVEKNTEGGTWGILGGPQAL